MVDLMEKRFDTGSLGRGRVTRLARGEVDFSPNWNILGGFGTRQPDTQAPS
jgi:hypothetical protein